MSPPLARLTIDLDAVAHNFAALKAEAGSAETAPVVKADGYGLGAIPVARRLTAEGARTFFVARLDEGTALRKALGSSPVIYVFDGCPAGAADRLRAANLRPVLNSLEQIAAYGEGGAALHVDTGMNRLGLSLEDAVALAANPALLSRIGLTLVMSHLACAGQPGHPMNAAQLARFQEVRGLFPNAPASLSSSGGIFFGPDYAFDLVRPGISLYGGGPHDDAHASIRPVVTFEAAILQVRGVKTGETIGYGATHTFEALGEVAVVAAGYADGFLRSSAGRGHAWYRGASRRLLGRLSMDLIALDVTDAGARAGDVVELIGPHCLIDDVAKATGTASYEVLTRLSTRAERVYLGEA
ncbi:MAG: alanine racemase [Caulobacteraceae bacterium]